MRQLPPIIVLSLAAATAAAEPPPLTDELMTRIEACWPLAAGFDATLPSEELMVAAGGDGAVRTPMTAVFEGLRAADGAAFDDLAATLAPCGMTPMALAGAVDRAFAVSLSAKARADEDFGAEMEFALIMVDAGLAEPTTPHEAASMRATAALIRLSGEVSEAELAFRPRIEALVGAFGAD